MPSQAWTRAVNIEQGGRLAGLGRDVVIRSIGSGLGWGAACGYLLGL